MADRVFKKRQALSGGSDRKMSAPTSALELAAIKRGLERRTARSEEAKRIDQMVNTFVRHSPKFGRR